MIRVNRIVKSGSGGLRGKVFECEKPEDAAKHFDSEATFVVVRYDTDEEWLSTDLAISKMNERAVQAATLANAVNPTCMQWGVRVVTADGQGWRQLWGANLAQVQMQGIPEGPPNGMRFRR